MSWPIVATSCWVYPLVAMDEYRRRRPSDIDGLDLPFRVSNALHCAGIHTVEELLCQDSVDMECIRGIGRLSYRQICEALTRLGISIPAKWPRPRAWHCAQV